jgi:predicted ATPase/DNA-binding XRE family transcriptional regulator
VEAVAIAASPSDFGSILRRLRHSAGLSQEELAEQSGVSARAVSDMERGLRRQPRPETLRLLADALALSDDSRALFYAAAHLEPDPVADRSSEQSSGGSAAIPAPLRSLPHHPEKLIGRTEDIATIESLLLDQKVRLITLTGPGGVGKTRVALEAARQLASSFADGAEFIDLSAVRDADQVAGAIARALGIREYGHRPAGEMLMDVLGPAQRLLVLDNFEQVIEAAPVVGALLAAAPRVQILITSRETLRIRDERELPIRPFALPGPLAVTDIGTGLINPAIALFVATAQTVRPGFTLTADNAAVVVDICRRLDGLPLAIELAAARLKHFPPELLLSRMQQRLPVLAGGPRDAPTRHQTLRDTIAWSYELLDPAEQQLFRTLGVFAGGATYDAIETVASLDGSLDVMTGLGSLVDKSLVVEREEAGGTPRFVLLETIREFALAALRDAGELDRARETHAHWLVALVELAYAEVDTETTGTTLDRLNSEHENIVDALSWATRSGNAELAVRMTGALWFHWYIQGHWSAGIEWLKTALALEDPLPSLARATTWSGLGLLAHYQGDRTTSTEALARGLELARSLDNASEIGSTLLYQGIAAEDIGDFETAEQLFLESQIYARRAGDQWAIGVAEMHLGIVLLGRDELDHAVACFVAVIENAARIELTLLLYFTFQMLGETYCRLRAFPDAANAFERAMELLQQSQVHEGVTYISMDIAALAVAVDLYPEGARFFGWSEQQLREIGANPPPVPEKWHYDEARERARARLGDETFERMWADGAEGPPEQRARDIETVFATARAHAA